MRFSVESWAPEYGVGADEQRLIEVDAPVDAGIERAAADWAAITPSAGPAGRVVFVDGVRRIDARIWLDDGRGRSWGAVCASVGAGAVVAAGGCARLAGHRVRRVLVAPIEAGAEAITTHHGRYDAIAAHGDDPADHHLAIHEAMTELELDLDVEPGADLVVYDGPLRGRQHAEAVGYIKTQRVQYLDDELAPVVAGLGPGERTPIFLVGGPRGLSRYSAYLRLPGPRTHPWAGIVRLEVPGSGTVAAAVERLDTVTATLPRFASDPHKDPRAPQNLYPIAGLEHRLRHLLGDPLILERALRVAAASGPP